VIAQLWMGHTSPETTAGYVHLSAEHLAAEYAVAQARLASSRSTR
jgi:integrase/recombinase XerC